MPTHPIILREKMFKAIRDNNVEQVAALVEGIKDVSLLDQEHSGPVYWAASEHSRAAEAIMAILLRAGCNVNILRKLRHRYETPLIVAIEEGALKNVRLLLEAGADPNLSGSDGNTALMSAARFENLKALKLLIEHGADLNVTNARGLTALSILGDSEEAVKAQKILEAAGATPPKASKTPKLKLGDPGRTQGRVQARLKGKLPKASKSKDIAKQRGVITFDYNNEALFAEADVEDVAQALVDNFEASDWQPNVAGQEVTIGKHSCLVFRLRGHSWSVILDVHTAGFSSVKTVELSEKSAAPVLHYGVSDTADVVFYSISEDGQQLETFGEGGERKAEFKSAVRHKAAVIGLRTNALIKQTFRRLDLLEPAISVRELVGWKPEVGKKVVVTAMDDIERIDFINCKDILSPFQLSIRDELSESKPEKPKTTPRIKAAKPFNDALKSSTTEPIASRRGIETMQADQIVLMAHASIDQVGQNLADQLGLQLRKSEELDDKQADDAETLVLKLRGHNWVLVIEKEFNEACHQVLKQLTKDVDSEGLLCAVKADVGEAAYRWMANGYCLQQLESLDQRRANDPFVETFIGDVITDPEFYESDRQLGGLDAGDEESRRISSRSLEGEFESDYTLTLEQHVDDFFAEHNAYVPHLDFDNALSFLSGKSQTTGSLSSSDIEAAYVLVPDESGETNGQIPSAKRLKLNVKLEAAIKADDLENAKSALADGADSNVLVEPQPKSFFDDTGNESMTMLGLATKLGHLDLIEALLDHGAEVDLVADDKDPALFWAITFGHFEALELLLKRGADPNIKSTCYHGQGSVPLPFAAIVGHFKMVRLLIKHGADIQATDDCGSNVLINSVHSYYVSSGQTGKSGIQFLLEAGIDPNHRDQNGKTALFYAAELGCDDVIEVLVAGGADPSLQDKEGKIARDFYSPKSKYDRLIKAAAKKSMPVKKKTTKKKTATKKKKATKKSTAKKNAAAKKKTAKKTAKKKTATKKKKKS